MFEAQPLERVGKLDVDAEIVGIELELVALEQPALLVDVHQQRGDVAVDRELPVPVARRIGLEIDPRYAVGQLGFRVAISRLGAVSIIGMRQQNWHYSSYMHYNS